MKRTIVLLTALTMGLSSFAQIKTPQPSQTAAVYQDLGLGKLSVAYSRPNAKGRVIFGDVVPFDKMWRTGANASTKFYTSEEIKMEGNTIPAGKYALYTIPGKLSWTIILHKDTTFWGDGGSDYKQENDLVRFTVKPVTTATKAETFTISFDNLTTSSATMNLAWENTIVPVKIEADIDAKVMNSIKSAVNPSPSAGTYYQAANYYYENGKDLNEAMVWVNKAIEMRPTAYWMSHLKAKIQLKIKEYDAAVASANASIEGAKKDGNEDYVHMNEKLIADVQIAKEAANKPAAPVKPAKKK